jgi:hypothetical protein
VLVVAATSVAAIDGTACGVACAVGAGVAGADVGAAVTPGVAGCAGVDEVHPAMNAVSTNSPHTMPRIRILFVCEDRFMIDRSIVLLLFTPYVKYVLLFSSKINYL